MPSLSLPFLYQIFTIQKGLKEIETLCPGSGGAGVVTPTYRDGFAVSNALEQMTICSICIG